jgi:hypothetical protein
MSLILTIYQLTLPSMIQYLRLFGNFYKRLLVVNVLISLILALLSSNFLLTLGLSFMSAGFLMSLLYQEQTHKTEYYFYYNKGISKLRLILVSGLLNVTLGLIPVLM